MSNDFNYNVNQVVRLPPTQSQQFAHDSQQTLPTSLPQVRIHDGRLPNNDLIYNEIYVNRVQLPPSQSQVFESSQHTVRVDHSSHFNRNRIHPPSYSEAIHSPNVEAITGPPPSYDSLYCRVIDARKQSKGLLDFLKNVFVLLLGTLGCTIILCITIVIPVCMVVIGSMYLRQCPQGQYIPVYLIVGGFIGIHAQLVNTEVYCFYFVPTTPQYIGRFLGGATRIH